MNNDTTEKFDREGCACAVQRERCSASVQKASHCSLGIQLLLAQRQVTTLAALLIQYIMSSRDADDDLCAF